MSTSEDINEAPEASTSAAPPALTPSNFRFLAFLDQGGFGKVWFAHALNDNQICAIKVIEKNPAQVRRGKDGLTDFEREVDCLKRVDPSFPYITQIFENFSTPQYNFLVMEYFGCGDMYDHLRRHKRLPESQVRLYIAELGCALQHLHDRNIIFRDLKLENIMLAADGHLKLIDFGVSKVMTTETTDSDCGSRITMAPEIMLQEEYDDRADWYSLGVVTYEMLTGRPPFDKEFDDVERFAHLVMWGEIPIPSNLSEECQDLLAELLEKDPQSRLVSFDELISHEWFREYSPDAVLLKLYEPEYVPQPRKRLELSQFEPEFQHPGAEMYYHCAAKDHVPSFLLATSSGTSSEEESIPETTSSEGSGSKCSSFPDSSQALPPQDVPPPDVSPLDVLLSDGSLANVLPTASGSENVEEDTSEAP